MRRAGASGKVFCTVIGQVPGRPGGSRRIIGAGVKVILGRCVCRGAVRAFNRICRVKIIFRVEAVTFESVRSRVRGYVSSKIRIRGNGDAAGEGRNFFLGATDSRAPSRRDFGPIGRRVAVCVWIGRIGRGSSGRVSLP